MHKMLFLKRQNCMHQSEGWQNYYQEGISPFCRCIYHEHLVSQGALPRFERCFYSQVIYYFSLCDIRHLTANPYVKYLLLIRQPINFPPTSYFRARFWNGAWLGGNCKLRAQKRRSYCLQSLSALVLLYTVSCII